MPGLRQIDDPEDLRCRECEVRDAVGPCATCEAMICGDCGVISADPAGKKVICLSCARLVAAVAERPLRRRTTSGKAIAVALLIGFAVATLSYLLR